jgi:hypothetical protein
MGRDYYGEGFKEMEKLEFSIFHDDESSELD